MSYISELNLKIADNRYIYPPVLLIALLSFAAYFFSGFQAALLVTLILSLLYLSLISFHIYRGIVKEIYYQDQRTQALFNIHSIVKPRFPLPYLTGWAAFPELISCILTEVKRSKPNHIVEIGSGSSTIITSYLLQELNNGHISSLDHDEAYGEKTRKELILHGLKDVATVYYRPLISHSINGKQYSWYDTSNLNLDKKSVGILVVDGPPEKTQSHARYPALPLFYEYLTDDAVVILDDAGRKEESETVEMWLKEFPEFSHEFIHTEKGISILKRNSR